MGSLIGILSTVILVSTVCTLIFAVGAYIIARRVREGVNMEEGSEMPGEDLMEKEFPRAVGGGGQGHRGTAVFKRVAPSVSEKAASDDVDDEYKWK